MAIIEIINREEGRTMGGQSEDEEERKEERK